MEHWLMLTGGWEYPDRSMIKMTRVIGRHAMNLAAALSQAGAAGLEGAITVLRRALGGGACKVGKRKRHPSTSQLLLNPSLGALS